MRKITCTMRLSSDWVQLIKAILQRKRCSYWSYCLDEQRRGHTTYLRPIVTYACETWARIKGDEGKLAIFERKILRRIYGPAFYVVLGVFKRRKNNDLQRLLNKPNICKFLSSERLEWAGHVWRAEGCIIRKFLTRNLSGKRPIRRSRQRCLDTARRDLTWMDLTFSINLESSKNHWRQIVEAALDLNGLFWVWEEEEEFIDNY